MNRRSFLKKTFWGLLGTSFVTGAYAYLVEPFWVEFVKRQMPIKHLPSTLEGKTLMQISDLHVGNRFDYHYLIRALKKAQTLEPDFVVYTGDYVSYENEQQFAQLSEVLPHFTKGKLGTYAVLGNHDYGHRWQQTDVAEKITELLNKQDIQVLRNTQVSNNGLNFIGLDDFWGTNFAPEPVLKQVPRQRANIVLCHNPDVCDLNIWGDYKGWILAGHTHGGQVKPPFLPPPVLPVKNARYSAGEFEITEGRKLYINRALGHLWQVRFNVRPEITLFELVVV